MRTKLILIMVLCFTVFSIKAQVIRLIDKSDLQGISNAHIINFDTTKSVITNQKGYADLSNFDLNEILFISHKSFQSILTTKADIIKNKNEIMLTDNVFNLNETVITANKTNQTILNIPNKVEVISSKQIMLLSPQTSADLLQQNGNVFIQQSQMGGGSAVLRGFESNKILLVVDGVRLNNAIYRGGHSQYILTIDPSAIENTEIIFGPGSVIYGSDALGGVISFNTKNPIFWSDDKFHATGSASIRYSSANNEKHGNLYLNYSKKKWGFVTTFSYKDLGDLRTGAVRNPLYGDWGKRTFTSEFINGKDSMISNSDYNLQKNSAYSQLDFMQKIIYKLNDNVNFSLNFQLSNSSNINRYDRLTETSSGKPSYAEWYYGPQFRNLISLNTQFEKSNILYDKANLIIAYQNIKEDRISRKFNSTNRKHQNESVKVFSLNYDLQKQISKNDLFVYGIEAIYNDVQSEAYNEKITTSALSYNTATRYPDAGSEMFSAALFASNSWTINKKLKFSQGLRFSAISLNALYSDSMMKITKFPFDNEIKQQSSALNGNLGIVFLPGNDWKIASTLSSGFRVPNVDDVSKVNDSKGSDKLLIIPNPDLKAEYAYNADITIGKMIQNRIQIEGTGFYTLLQNAIVSRPTTLNGIDSVQYEGIWSKVITNVNAGEAYVYGFQAAIKAQVSPSFSINSSLSYSFGHVKSDGVPLDHIPPVYGITTFKLEKVKFKGEFFIRYNGWKRLKDYSPSGEDNLMYATSAGTPSWYTLNLRCSYQFNKYLNLVIGIDNITDLHYRVFASGISAPGRNVSLTIRTNF